jgi:diguanylate cyclase (GGDEF)-like protein/PAS domain S-box-containing protein
MMPSGLQHPERMPCTQRPQRLLNSPFKVVVTTGVVVFAIELAIMLTLTNHTGKSGLDIWDLLDPLLLTLLLSPLLHQLVFKPMRRQQLALEQQLSALQRNEQLKALLDALPDAVVLKDAEGRWLVANEPARRLFHLTEHDWQGKTEGELVALHPSFGRHLADSASLETLAWTSGALQVRELGIGGEQPDKPTRVIETRAMPMVGAAGERRGMALVRRDVTERKQAEVDMRIAATAFESHQGMTIADANKVILRVNQAFSDITGYSQAEAVGQTPKLLSSGRHDAAFYAAMWRSIVELGSWQGEVWNRRKNGELFPEWLTITAVKDAMGVVTHYVATFSDITERKSAEEKIQHLAFFDPLTHLPNRRLLQDRLQHAVAASSRHQGQIALLLIDLDDFKTINDTLGHDDGDLLLQQVAQRLCDCVRSSETVARLGGDEFVVLLEHLDEDAEEAARQAELVGDKILHALNQPYQVGGSEHLSTASIGITLFDNGLPSGADDPLKRAELAMYQAKAAGRNTLRFFDPQMQASVNARVRLESDLRHAVHGQQLLLHYQAQVSREHGITGAEVLVRWRHPERGMVSPAEFIPLAEDTGLILPLGQWVLDTACAQLALWAQTEALARLTIAVNVSARQFHHKDFVASVLATLARTGATPQRLKLELTESLLVTDVEGVIAKMRALRERGVGFSLDDFGTGYSSLAYLKRLPLDQLKIDQGFVRDILIDPDDAAIARTVIALADSLGLAVIAEGVETQDQLNSLARMGCGHYQGYFFSKPLPVAEFEALVTTGGA